MCCISFNTYSEKGAAGENFQLYLRECNFVSLSGYLILARAHGFPRPVATLNTRSAAVTLRPASIVTYVTVTAHSSKVSQSVSFRLTD